MKHIQLFYNVYLILCSLNIVYIVNESDNQALIRESLWFYLVSENITNMEYWFLV